MKDKINFRLLSRYRNLIASISIFILLIFSILFSTFFISREINRQAQIIDTTSYLRDEMNAMLLGLFNLKTYSSNINEQIVLLEGNVNNFDHLLQVMDKGGTFDSQSGYGNLKYHATVTIPLSETKVGQAQITTLKHLWSGYHTEIDAYLKTGGDDAQQLNFALEAGMKSYVLMYHNLNTVMEQAVQHSKKWNGYLKYIQILGVVILMSYFFIFLFYFIRQLVESDKQAERSEQGRRDIMKTVDIGLFLLDREMNIAGEYSAKLEDIIGVHNVQGKNFVELLSNLIAQDRLEATRVFVDQLYSEWVIERLLDGLNPLKKIEINVVNSYGNTVRKILSFRFSRVMHNKEIHQILVNVTDITEAVETERELQSEQGQSDRYLNMVGSILKADTALMADFADLAERKSQLINEILQKPGNTEDILHEKVRLIHREVHALKGDASSLEIQFFVSEACDIESELKILKNKTHLSGNDFLGLTIKLEQLIQVVQVTKQLADAMTRNNSLSSKNDSISNEQYYCRFADQIATRNGKKVKVKIRGLDDHPLIPSLHESIKDIIIQLLRNAIVHGIEPADIRKQRSKSEIGNIEVSLYRTEHNLELCVADDGQGLDYEAIKQKAIHQNIVRQEEVSGWSKSQITALIFHSGLSTVNTSAEDAGEGAGMDIVKNRISRLRGKLRISSVEMKFTRFTVLIPQQF